MTACTPPPPQRQVDISTAGSNFNTVLAVYNPFTTPIACNGVHLLVEASRADTHTK
jgi:hypothetical protein